jgi:hypothetical protein
MDWPLAKSEHATKRTVNKKLRIQQFTNEKGTRYRVPSTLTY